MLKGGVTGGTGRVGITHSTTPSDALFSVGAAVA